MLGSSHSGCLSSLEVVVVGQAGDVVVDRPEPLQGGLCVDLLEVSLVLRCCGALSGLCTSLSRKSRRAKSESPTASTELSITAANLLSLQAGTVEHPDRETRHSPPVVRKMRTN